MYICICIYVYMYIYIYIYIYIFIYIYIYYEVIQSGTFAISYFGNAHLRKAMNYNVMKK